VEEIYKKAKKYVNKRCKLPPEDREDILQQVMLEYIEDPSQGLNNIIGRVKKRFLRQKNHYVLYGIEIPPSVQASYDPDLSRVVQARDNYKSIKSPRHRQVVRLLIEKASMDEICDKTRYSVSYIRRALLQKFRKEIEKSDT
jgi:DNA-binding CsgD family transcriptional regulator